MRILTDTVSHFLGSISLSSALVIRSCSGRGLCLAYWCLWLYYFFWTAGVPKFGLLVSGLVPALCGFTRVASTLACGGEIALSSHAICSVLALDTFTSLISKLNFYEIIAKHCVVLATAKTLLSLFSRASSGKLQNLR